MGKIVYETEGKLNFLLILMNIKDVTVYNPKQIENKCYFAIKASDKYKAEEALNSCGKTFSIIANKSVNAFLSRMKKRIGLFVGIALSVLITAIWSLTVTDIEISGNELIEDDYIIEQITSMNKFPISRTELNLKEIEKKLVAENGISNVSLEIKGNTLFVNILEEFKYPNIVDFNDKSDIISKYDAIITEIVTFSGEAKVKCGDTVKKGDVLISHIKTLNDGTTLESKALGRIKGRIWVSQECIIGPEKTVYERTGNNVVLYTIGDMPQYKTAPYKHYEYEKCEVYFSSLFPLKLNKHIYYETQSKTKKINYNKEKSLIIAEKTKELEKSLPETAIKVKTWYSEKIVDKNIVLVIYYEIIDSLIN